MADHQPYVFVADDFTGATDTLATLGRAGLRVRLFLEVPPPEAVQELDAFGIATEGRALGNEAYAALMRGIGERLVPHRPGIVHLKICSTFDSAPQTGNFVVAMEALGRATGIRRQAIVGGQPSLGRYCVFGHLFARAADGRVHRIDRHPVMCSHPVTPMTESDLSEHVVTLGGGRPVMRDRLTMKEGPAWTPQDDRPLLFDALDDEDIASIGQWLSAGSRLLCAGASSVAEAVAGQATRQAPTRRHLRGPVLVFAGSRSAVTAAQVDRASAYAKIAVSPKRLVARDGPEILRDQAASLLSEGRNVLLFLEEGASDGGTPRKLAERSAELVAALHATSRPGALVVASATEFLGETPPKVRQSHANNTSRPAECV